MRTTTATEASRHFSDLLDEVEAGASIVVKRGGRPVAEIRPVRAHTGKDLRRALAGITPPDERFGADIADAVAALDDEQADPWADR
ncbi:MAG: type II toxin-antitoxin system prevent-host-death family antitoxin [Pseudoclavibacter sp.]